VNRRHIKLPTYSSGAHTERLDLCFVALLSYLMTYCLICLFVHASQFSLVMAHFFWATVCKTVSTMLSVRCLSVCLSVTFVHCCQTAGWITMPLGVRVGLGPCHIVLDGDPVPLPKGVEVRISKLERMCGALPIVTSVVALGQQIILVKTRSESV